MEGEIERKGKEIFQKEKWKGKERKGNISEGEMERKGQERKHFTEKKEGKKIRKEERRGKNKKKGRKKKKLAGGLAAMWQVVGNSLSAILGAQLIGVSLVE